MAGTGLLFMLCFVLAQADKQVLGLIAVPLQRSFALTDTELGFLQGAAFALAFAIGGLPVARLVDGGHRVRIAAICVALWSVATILCGFAWSFVMLLVCRAATAVSEAGLPPAALSVFSQSGDPRTTAKLTNGFMLGPFVGGGLVLAGGGLLLGAVAGVTLPGNAEPWRLVFFAVGVPGLVLAPLLYRFGREPPRPELKVGATPLPPYATVLRTIFIEKRYLGFYYTGLACFYLYMAALIAWYPVLLVRELHLSPAAAGAHAGVTYLVGGVAGTVAAMIRASLRARVDVPALMRDFVAAAALLVPIGCLLPLASGLAVSLALYGAYAFASAAVIASMAIPIQLSLPTIVLGRAMATFSLIMSAFAGSAGPLVIGIVTDRTGLPLGTALAATGLLAGAAACLLLNTARHLRSWCETA